MAAKRKQPTPMVMPLPQNYQTQLTHIQILFKTPFKTYYNYLKHIKNRLNTIKTYLTIIKTYLNILEIISRHEKLLKISKII